MQDNYYDFVNKTHAGLTAILHFWFMVEILFYSKVRSLKERGKRGNSSRCFGTCSNHETCMHLNWSVQGRLRYSHNTIKIYRMSHRYWDNLANCLHTMIFLRIRIFYRKKTKYEVFLSPVLGNLSSLTSTGKLQGSRVRV